MTPTTFFCSAIALPLSRIGFRSIHEHDDLRTRRAAQSALATRVKTVEGEKTMEMHSRQSLYDIHGISIERRRRRSRLIGRRLVARVVSLLTKLKRAIQTELAIRRAINELAQMDDHMLRDLGVHRSEIEGRLRRQQRNVGTDASAISNPTADSHLDLPTVNSPLIVSEGRPEQESRKLHSLW